LVADLAGKGDLVEKGSLVSSMSSPKRRLGGPRALVAAGVAVAVFAVPAVAYAAGTFTDVSSKNAYYKDVKAATTNGVIAGCSKTKFCPKAPATRQDLARLANRLGALTPGGKAIVNAKTALTAADAAHATSADSATTALTAGDAAHATSADSATTASNATSLGGVAASNYLQNAGQIQIAAPNSTWQKFASGDGEMFQYYSSSTQIDSSVQFSGFVENSVSAPTASFGTQTALVGVQLCYVASVQASITYVEVNVSSADPATGAASRTIALSDGTVREDGACRVYKSASPIALGSTSAVSIYLGVALSGGQPLTLSNTTFIFAPTSTPVTPLVKKVTTLKAGKSRVNAPVVAR
jgi:hypothetical protein